MIRVAIIGGGISGLSAGYYLEQARRAGAQLEYTIFEATNRLGGVIQTEHRNDFLIEVGPDSFMTAKPWAAELAKELGMADQLMASNDADRKTYILIKGKLVAMPDGLQMMVPTKALPVALSPLFSWETKTRMLREYFSPPTPLQANTDESVASFVGRHFGDEVTERLASPLLAGIYGGDASRLSARAVLPRFVEMEAEHGSLVRGVLASAHNAAPAKQSIFTTFKRGMQQLVEAIANRLDAGSVRTGVTVEKIEEVSGRWKVIDAAGQTTMFNQVIVAVPAYSAGKMLRSVDTELSRRLEEVTYASTVTVALTYEKSEALRCKIPVGFGFLVPRSENIPIMACTFVQNKFAYRAASGNVLLRMFLADAIDWPDEKIRQVVQEQLGKILKITEPSSEVRVSRWSRSMPQYEVGHLERVASIERRVRQHVGLELIGNAYRGIGVPDCVREGKEAAGRVLKGILAS